MKRIVAFILILTLWGFALADTGIDWTEYPDDELQKTADEMTEMLNEIQNEIERRNREKSEEKTLGIETDVLLASFDGYLDTFTALSGLQHYTLSTMDVDKSNPSLVLPMTKHCSLDIDQVNGLVKHFRVVSDKDDGSSGRTEEIIVCFMAALMLTNSYFTEENTVSELNKIMSDREEHVYGDVTYRFVSTAPITTIIGLEVTPTK